MNRILIITLLATYIYSHTNAAVLNRTDPNHILPVPVEELGNVRASRQQITGCISCISDGTAAFPPSIASNTANILTGLHSSDVRPIIVGGTNFIPAGDLREGVQDLLLGLTPAIQNVIFGSPNEQANQPVQTALTAPPTHIKIIIKHVYQNELNSTVVGRIPPPTTTTPVPTLLQPNTIAHPPPIILRYRVKPTDRSTTTTPFPERLSSTITRIGPNQILVYLPQPNETYTNFPQSSHLLPDSSKLNSHLPESPNSEIKNFASINPHLPESPMTDDEIKNIIKNKYIQLLKVVEEAEVVPAQVSTTEKQFVYLVLPPEDYKDFLKFSSKYRPSSSKSQLQSSPELSLKNADDQPQSTVIGNVDIATSTRSPPSTNNAGSSIIQAPTPRVKGNEDDDSDEKSNFITDLIDAILDVRE